MLHQIWFSVYAIICVYYTGQQKITFRLLPGEKHLVYTNWGVPIPNMQSEILHHVRIFSYDDMPIYANYQILYKFITITMNKITTKSVQKHKYYWKWYNVPQYVYS